jgi:hypothetical protein
VLWHMLVIVTRRVEHFYPQLRLNLSFLSLQLLPRSISISLVGLSLPDSMGEVKSFAKNPCLALGMTRSFPVAEVVCSHQQHRVEKAFCQEKVGDSKFGQTTASAELDRPPSPHPRLVRCWGLLRRTGRGIFMVQTHPCIQKLLLGA